MRRFLNWGIMNGEISDFDIAKATAYVSEAWTNVFATSNLVIKQSGLYGFDGIELIPKPNIHQMLATMTVVSTMLDKIIEHLGCVDIPHHDTRLLFNAKQQILRLEQVAAALLAKDEPLYNEAIAELEKQAVF